MQSDKIKHLWNHAGSAGHAQALHLWEALLDLKLRAMRSKKGQSDVTAINSMIASLSPLMDEMKQREKAAIDARVGNPGIGI